jgi:hypothetical protein
MGIDAIFADMKPTNEAEETPVVTNTLEPEVKAVKARRAAKNDDRDIRATFIVKESRLDQLKAIAYWDRAKIKDIHDTALAAYIETRSDIPAMLTKRKARK